MGILKWNTRLICFNHLLLENPFERFIANLCFALAFCSVLSWCLRLTSYVCAVCSLPCSLILPFPPLCSFSLSTLTHQSTNNAPPFVVVICPALVGGSVLGWLYIVLDQFTQIWPSC